MVFYSPMDPLTGYDNGFQKNSLYHRLRALYIKIDANTIYEKNCIWQDNKELNGAPSDSQCIDSLAEK